MKGSEQTSGGERTLRKRIAQRFYRAIAGESVAGTNIFISPGHFYSPLPDLQEIRAREADLFKPPPAELPGIDLRAASQLVLLEEFSAFYRDMAFAETPTQGLRTCLDNPRYGFFDTISLYCMLRHLAPARMIEVGSGYSSCVSLDTNERYLGGRMKLTFIEPYPEVLMGLVGSKDFAPSLLVEKKVQDVDMDLFKSLDAGDILFIDSTHVAKVGSDVNHLFFNVLPVLKSGVFIHIHDIFYPLEYPKEWIYEGRAWNEAYLLRCFLMHNSAYEIVFWNDYLGKFHSSALAKSVPLALRNTGGAIWLRKK